MLANDLQPCATAAPYPYLALTPEFGAQVHDPDETDVILDAEFAIWPVAAPDQRTVLPRSVISNGFFGTLKVPAGLLADDTTYGWQVRTFDGTDYSGWAQTCFFVTDGVGVASAPGVTSTNYPPNGATPGVPAEFTFTANGVADVAGYQFTWSEIGVLGGADIGPFGVPNSGPVQTIAAGPDGTASFQVTAPSQPDFVTVHARSTSANGWVSPEGNWVRFVDSAPAVSSPDFPENDYGGQVGVAGTFTFAPRLPDVVSYLYGFDSGPQQTVSAGSDGTASISYTPASPDFHYLEVFAVTADGTISDEYFYGFAVNPAP